MIFEDFNGLFCGIDSIVVGLHNLVDTVLGLQECFDLLAGLIIGDIEVECVTMGGVCGEHLCECLHDVFVCS